MCTHNINRLHCPLQLELAMERRSLDPGNQMWHYRQMKMMEEEIIRSGGHMQKILVVEKDGMEENATEDNTGEFYTRTLNYAHFLMILHNTYVEPCILQSLLRQYLSLLSI